MRGGEGILVAQLNAQLVGQLADLLDQGVSDGGGSLAVELDGGGSGDSVLGCLAVLGLDPVEVGLIVEALGEGVGVEVEAGGDGEGCVAAEVVGGHVEVVEVPPGALVAGALGGEGGEDGGRAVIEDVRVLEADLSGADEFVDQSRLNLSRESAAVASKEVGELGDHDRRVGLAERVAVGEHPGAAAGLDDLADHGHHLDVLAVDVLLGDRLVLRLLR